MTAWYNENDPFAAQWLRNLIASGHITNGEVEDRPIDILGADDIPDAARCHFFAGIAGWDLALSLAGWPDDLPVWTGSCPCQPFSAAGKRRGADDPRHLWPAWRSLIAVRRPPVIVGEQVASSDGREWLAGVRTDLEALGYAFGAADLCAASVGAPHIRQRLFWVAESNGGLSGDGRLQRGGEHLQRAQDSGARGVAHPESRSARRAGVWRGASDDSKSRGVADAQGGDGSLGRGPRQADPESGGGGEVGGMGEPYGALWAEAGSGYAFHARGEPEPGLPHGGMGHAPGLRCNRTSTVRRSENEATNQGRLRQPPGAGPWRSALWHPCSDGVARRIPAECGFFPLVAGIPTGVGRDGRASLPLPSAELASPEARTGRLRGYGNSITIAVAVEFIAAYMEVRGIEKSVQGRQGGR